MTRGSAPKAFDALLQPGRIGPLHLKNRVVLPAMDMNLCAHGHITDAEIAHYRRRAEGGAALLITGSGAVAFPVGATSRLQPGLSDDRFIAGLTRLADAIHESGSQLCVQLCHHGKNARVDIAEDRAMLAPSMPSGATDLSSLQDNTTAELEALAAATGGKSGTVRVADEDDLALVIDQFAAAARRCQVAGADAVEIHAAHGYLLSTFLSAADNHRTDRWGGSIRNRCRLTEEVIAAVRSSVGADLAILVRVSGQEFGDADGLTNAEAVAAARRFERAGADAIHVTGWGRNSFANFTDGPLPDAEGAYRAQAAAVKRAVEIPVIAVGRLLPEVAEAMVEARECDFVAMGRQLLADADLVDKLASGGRATVRPCINCYVCVEQNFFDATPRCAVNPEVGRQSATEPARTTERRHIVVVGGGPAGMEFARLGCRRGHRVTLVEASERLGGTAWFSQLTTPANGPFIEWQARELERCGVEVRLGTTADATTLRALGPDQVVVATGAARTRPDVAGIDQGHVLTGDSLRALLAGEAVTGQPRWRRWVLRLARSARITTSPARLRSLSRWYLPLGKHVVILGGGLVGLELAEFAAERGRSVTVLEPGPAVGLPMASPRRWSSVRRAVDHGVVLHRDAEPIEITAHDVAFRVAGEEHRVAADSVVVAGGVEPSTAFADQLRTAGFEVDVIGDALDVGYIEGAVHGAWRLAAELDPPR